MLSLAKSRSAHILRKFVSGKKIIFDSIPFVIFSFLCCGIIISGKFYNSEVNIESYSEPDSAYAAYFPIATGNSYTYLNTTVSLPPIPPYKSKARITKDTMIEGKKYFYCTNFPFIGTGWVRFDTATGNLLKRISPGCSVYPNDKILDSLRSKINNVISCQFEVWYSRTCLDTAITTIFNLPKKSILFKHDGIMWGNTRYAKDFGIVYSCSGEPPPCSDFKELKGCVINGIVYGDTSLTGITNLNSEIPDKFALYQNFPNPFNPVTKIKFDIPSNDNFPLRRGAGGMTTLKIFDITGREIRTLVNEKLNPGSYEVTFEGSNFASGMYFYQLRVGDFIETKKLILLK
jgi:hypothetical protein